jgi:uncharacterized protein YrrD
MASESVRYSDLLNQIVLKRSTMAELGKVEVLWEYPQAHRVFGFICKSGAFDRTKTAFNLDQLETIGDNGILVRSDPVETDADRVRQIESLIGSEVWTDMGNRLGRINDHIFDLKTGAIKLYLFSPGGLKRLAGPVYALYPTQVLGWGSRRVVVSAGIANQLEVYEPGVHDRLSRFAEVFNTETTQVGQGLLERAKAKAKRAGTQAQILAEQARDRAQALSAELLESAEYARGQAQNLRDEFLEGDRAYHDDRQATSGDRRDAPTEDFDFDDWEEDQPPAARDDRRSTVSDRPPLNLEPKAPPRERPPVSERPPSPYAQRPAQSERPPSTPARDQDPWDDDWE